MRILSPSEQRQIEQLKRTLHSPHAVTLEICDDNKEMWLNILEMVLSTQEAIKMAMV